MKACFKSCSFALRLRSAVESSACAEAIAALRSASCARSCAVSNSATVCPVFTRSPSRTSTRFTSAATLARTVACETAWSVPGSSDSTDSRRRCRRTTSACVNSSGGLAPLRSASSWALRRCTVIAPTAAIAVSPRIAPAIHHLVFRFILRARLSAVLGAFLRAARRTVERAARNAAGGDGCRSSTVGEPPHAAVIGEHRGDLDHVIEIVVVEVPVQIEAARLHRAGNDRQADAAQDRARARLSRAQRMQQRHQGERDAGIGHHPDEAVVVPDPQPERGELHQRKRDQRLAHATARRSECRAGHHAAACEADDQHGGLPERLELEAVVRPAQRRAERQRDEGDAPDPPRILAFGTPQDAQREKGGERREQVIGRERHRFADHGLLAACTTISPRASTRFGCSAARSAAWRKDNPHSASAPGRASRETADLNGSFHSASSARSSQVALWKARRPSRLGSITVNMTSPPFGCISPMAAKSAAISSGVRYMSSPSMTNTERLLRSYGLAANASRSEVRARSAAMKCRFWR